MIDVTHAATTDALDDSIAAGQDLAGSKVFAGNVLLGAPDLTDDVWLYGSSQEVLIDGIANGLSGVMPPFQDRLDDAQIRMLVAWLTRDGE